MLDFCQPVSYYLKLSVLWVKKLLSEVDDTLPVHPHSPLTLGRGRRGGDVGENEGPPCPPTISQGHQCSHVSP